MKRKFFHHALLILSVCILAGCATARQSKKMPAPGDESSLKVLCERNGIVFNLDSVSQTVFLYRGSTNANAMIGSEIVLVDNERVVLSAPLKLERGVIVIPPDFQMKVIERMIKQIVPPEDYTVKRVRTIILDAGHGGKDPGAIGGSGIYEKTVVLDITQKLKQILERRGFKVLMTRSKDEFITLKDRTVLASERRADLFVSIHANAHAKRSVNGMEVYSLKDLDFFELNEAQRVENQEILYRSLLMEKRDEDLKKIVSDMLYTFKQGESSQLAEQISQQTAQAIKAKNLGAKTSHFFVLRNTLVPAILVEVGYLSNPKEEKLLKSKAYRQKIAHALAKGIIDYANE